MEAKSSSKMGFFSGVFSSAVCQLRSSQHRKFCSSEPETIFSPNSSNFDGECDWNRRDSQKIQTLGFSWKK